MKLTTENYIEAIDRCKSKAEAELLAQIVFEGGTTENPFHSKVPATWGVFYKLKKLEDKFELPHSASAYVVIDLIAPKISSIWYKKKNGDIANTIVEKSEYLNTLWAELNTKYIDMWDEKVNDNFLAFLLPHLSTIVNELLKPEIPRYLQETRGYTSVSLEGFMEKTESGFEPEDRKVCIEEGAVRSDEKNRSKIVRAKHHDTADVKLAHAAQIRRAIFASKLGGGYKELSETVIDAISYYEGRTMEEI